MAEQLLVCAGEDSGGQRGLGWSWAGRGSAGKVLVANAACVGQQCAVVANG